MRQPLKRSTLSLFIATLFAFIGCGGGGGGSLPSSNNSTSPGPQVVVTTTQVVVRHTLLNRGVPSYVDSYRFVGLNSGGVSIYGPVTVTKAREVTLDSVPLEVTTLRIEYLQGDSVRGLANLQVNLQATGPFIINDPDFQDVEAILSSLRLSSDSVQLGIGTSTLLTARGFFDNGGTSDFTESASWTTEDERIATFEGNRLRAISAGTTRFSASVGTLTAQGQVTVSTARIVDIRFSPSRLELPVGVSETVSFEAILSDGSVQALDSVELKSTNRVVAEVEAGSTIIAKQQGFSNFIVCEGDISSAIPVRVNEATLESIRIERPNTPVPVDFFTDLRAFGSYSNSTEFELTDEVVWTSLDESVVRVFNLGTPGLLEATGVGSTRVTATLGSVSAEEVLESNSATLDDINFAPHPSLIPGFKTRLQARGVFSDGFERPLRELTWQSSNNSVARITSYGLLEALSPGRTTVTATGRRGGSNSLDVDVQDGTLVRFSLQQNAWAPSQGQRFQIRATAKLQDGSTLDVTDVAHWWSEHQSVLTSLGFGEFEALNQGYAVATASVAGETASSTILVSSSFPVELILSGPARSVPVGADIDFPVQAIYPDGSKIQLESRVKWAWSGNSGNWDEVGPTWPEDLTPRKAGTYQITAFFQVDRQVIKSNSLTVNVIDTDLEKIKIPVLPLKLVRGFRQPLQAFGVFQDGNVYPINNSVNWSTEGLTGVSFGSSPEGLRVSNIGTGRLKASHRLLPLFAEGDITVEDSVPSTLKLLTPSPYVIRENSSQEVEVRLTFENGFETSDFFGLGAISPLKFRIEDSSTIADVNLLGTLSGRSVGTTTLTAFVDPGTGSDASDSVEVQVVSALRTLPFFQEPRLELLNGQSYPLKVFAYPVGTSSTTPMDFTNDFVWTSTEPSVATVSNDNGGKGVVEAREPGYTIISAYDPDSKQEARIGLQVIDNSR